MKFFIVNTDKTTYNKRVCGRVTYSFRLESHDSNLVLFASGRDRSDPAAHAEHYVAIKN